MSAYAPELTIKRGLVSVEIWLEEDKVYPHPTGKVNRKIDEMCRNLRGQRKSVLEVGKIVSQELTNEVQL